MPSPRDFSSWPFVAGKRLPTSCGGLATRAVARRESNLRPFSWLINLQPPTQNHPAALVTMKIHVEAYFAQKSVCECVAIYLFGIFGQIITDLPFWELPYPLPASTFQSMIFRFAPGDAVDPRNPKQPPGIYKTL